MCHLPPVTFGARLEPCRARRAAVAGRFAAAVLICGLSACQGSIPFADHDRYAHFTRDDFREALEPRPTPTEPTEDGPPIPELRTLVDLPPLPSPAESQLVSLSVTDTVPLKDVLIELARKAEVDLELDPRIEGGIILTMRDRPMREVIERIAKLAGLRFEFRDRSLKIELDEPYYVNYRLDYLELTRQASGNVETSTNQMSDAGVDGNASTSSVGSQSDVNFWQELEVSLEQILINSTPRPLVIRPAAAPLPLPAPEESTEPAEEGGADLPGEADPASDGLPSSVQDTFATPAVAPAEVAADADEDVVVGGGETAGQFTINRQAGIVSVFATKSQHELVATYLSELHSSITQQVLIEAKIMEVALSDEFESGINWRAFFDDKYGFAAPLGRAVAPPPFNLPSDATSDVVTLALNRGDLDVIANFIQRFGTVRTLSSPRVTVLQNQTAVLKVVENQVYFRLFFERIEDDNGDDQVNVNSEIQTVPVGVIIVVQPSINATTQDISLALRPTVTRVINVVNDPAVAIVSDNTVRSEIPVIGVQEIDSVVTTQSGQVVVMGGLMRDVSVSQDNGIPLLGQLPGVGYLFKAREDQYRQTELVIFLRATILEDGGIEEVDADLYRRFSGDRRPLPMPAVER